MKKYEVMYIINAGVEEEDRKNLIENLAKSITDEGGKVTKTDEWGMRDFAYPIEHMTKGYYVVVSFEAENETVAEFDRLMGINPNIVRFLITRAEELEASQGAKK